MAVAIVLLWLQGFHTSASRPFAHDSWIRVHVGAQMHVARMVSSAPLLLTGCVQGQVAGKGQISFQQISQRSPEGNADTVSRLTCDVSLDLLTQSTPSAPPKVTSIYLNLFTCVVLVL